jgi:hypothetical protein
MQAVRVSGAVPAFFHQSTSSFPYTGGAGKISITRQIFVAQYGPFYKWQISDFGTCQRIRVRATVATSCESSLPVELISFYGKPLTPKSNLLLWSTANENNNDYFILSKSKNGKDFQAIATIDGVGNSNAILHYSYTDNDAYNGNNYYRLTQVDYDGNPTHSEIIKIYNGTLDVSLAPNPFNTSATLNVYTDEIIHLKMMDMSGKTVYQKNNLPINSDITIGEELLPGIYILQLTSDDGIHIQKLIKQ